MKRHITFYVTIICLFLCANKASGQIPTFPDENPISIVTSQSLNFGEITLGSSIGSGTAKVDALGQRSTTGDVIMLGAGSCPAILQFLMPPGRVVVVTYSSSVDLNGSSGSALSLDISSMSIDGVSCVSGSQYNSNPDGSMKEVRFGGTLHIGPISLNPGGEYNGTFHIDVVLQ